MSLPTSGQIDLNAIHIEAGGVTGNACTINDSDIRGLISSTLGTPIDWAEFYGVSTDWQGADWGVTQYDVWNYHTLIIAGQAYSGIALLKNGTFEIYGSDMTTLYLDWHASPPPGAGDYFEYKYDIITIYEAGNGLSTSGLAENTWRTMDATNFIEALDQYFGGWFEDYLVRVHIRPIAGGTEVTQDFNLYAKWG